MKFEFWVFSSLTEYLTWMSMLVVVLNMLLKNVNRDQPVLKKIELI